MKKKNQAPTGAVAQQYVESVAGAVATGVGSSDAPAPKKSKKSEPVAEAKVEETPVSEEKPAETAEVAAEPPSGDAQ